MDRAEEKRLRKLRRQLRTRAWPERPTVFLVDSRGSTGETVARTLVERGGLEILADGPIEGLPSVVAASRATGFEAADVVVFCGLGWEDSDQAAVEEAIRAEAHVVLGPGGHSVADFGAPLQARARAKRVQVVYGCSVSGGFLGWLAWHAAGDPDEVVLGIGPSSGLEEGEWEAAREMLAAVPRASSLAQRVRGHLPAAARQGPLVRLGSLGEQQTLSWAGPALERRIHTRWWVAGVPGHLLRRGVRSRLRSLGLGGGAGRTAHPESGVFWRAEGSKGEITWALDAPAALSARVLASSCLALVREQPLEFGFRPTSSVFVDPDGLCEELGLPAAVPA